MALNIKNFKRLREIIASIPPRRIYMPWWFAKIDPKNIDARNGYIEVDDVPKSGCGTAGCIYGHCAFAFFPEYVEKDIYESDIFEKIDKFLGMDQDNRASLTSVASWPFEISRMYLSLGVKNIPHKRKAAVLARLDRIIERGDLL